MISSDEMATKKPTEDEQPKIGRPPRGNGPADEKITFRVTAEEKAAYLELAGATDQPLGDWIREGCNERVKRAKRRR
jgi:hypothetical protein